MIKIGILLQSNSEVGGIYQYCLSIIDATEKLDKKQFKIKYFYSEKFWEQKLPANADKQFIKNNFILKIIRKLIDNFLIGKENWRLLRNYIYEDVKILNKSDCDYVIMPSQNRASYLTNKKTITVIHDLMHLYEQSSKDYNRSIIKMRNKHYEMICKYSDYIFTDSNLGKKQILESYKCSSKKIFILPYTVPSYLNKNKSRKFNKKLPRKFLFYPAQFWQHKNHINLLHAFKKTENNKIKDLHLVFTGSKSQFYNEILDEVKKLNISNKVFFLDRVQDIFMRDLYKKSLATIFVSSLGPTNIPPLEAISVGSPLICSNVYAMKEQLKDAAIYVNPKNTYSIYRAILMVYKNKGLRKKLIIKGRNLSISKDKNTFNKNFGTIIKRIIK